MCGRFLSQPVRFNLTRIEAQSGVRKVAKGEINLDVKPGEELYLRIQARKPKGQGNRTTVNIRPMTKDEIIEELLRERGETARLDAVLPIT